MQRNLAGHLPTLSFASPIRPRKAGADDIEHPDQPPYGSAGDLPAQPPCGSTGEFILPPDQPPYGSVGDLPAQPHTVAQASSFFPLTSPHTGAQEISPPSHDSTALRRKLSIKSFLARQIHSIQAGAQSIRSFIARTLWPDTQPSDRVTKMDIEPSDPFVFKALNLSAYEATVDRIRDRVQSRQRSTVTASSRSLMIVDTGAQISCTNDLRTIRPDSYTRFDDTNAVTIEGIVEAANLKVEGAGLLYFPLDDIRILFAPEAADNVLSFFDIKKFFWIEMMHQDRHDEHLRLTHKGNPELVLICPIDPITGLYVVDTIGSRSLPHLEFAPTKSQIFHTTMLKRLQERGTPKLLAIRAGRIQAIHEAMSFCGKGAILRLIEQKRLGHNDHDLCSADWHIWANEYHDLACIGCPAGKLHNPDKVSSTSRPTERIGDALQADLFYVTCAIQAGNLTVLSTVDEATSYVNNRSVDSKAKGPLLAAFASITDEYRDNNHPIRNLKTDNEPALTSLKESLRENLGINLTHCEFFRHMTKAERSILYISELFLSSLHGAGIPIPAFLYTDLLQFVTHAANLTFNKKNDTRTPAELFRGDTINLAMYTKSKFGQLVSYYDGTPGIRPSDKPRNSYGIVIGYDPIRPHCTVIFDVVNTGGTNRRRPIAEYAIAEWTPGLKNMYMAEFAEHISPTLPVFLHFNGDAIARIKDKVTNNAGQLEDTQDNGTAAPHPHGTAVMSVETGVNEAEPTTATVPPSATDTADTNNAGLLLDTLRNSTVAPHLNGTAVMSVETGINEAEPTTAMVPTSATDAASQLKHATTKPQIRSDPPRRNTRRVRFSPAEMLKNPIAVASAAISSARPKSPTTMPQNTKLSSGTLSRPAAPGLRVPKYSEEAWNELFGIFAPDHDPNIVEAVSELLSHETEQLGAGIIPDQDSLSGRIKSNPRARVPKIFNLSIAKALKSYSSSKVTASVLKEIKQMIEYQVWDFLTKADLQEAYERGEVKNIIPSSLFLKMKSDLETLKARLIVHGDKQILLDLFGSNSSPTISITVLNLVISLAAKMNLDFESIDIAGAYLNAPLPAPEFMRINSDLASIIVDIDPEYRKFLASDGHMTVRLKKALYGLKTSGKLWYAELHQALVNVGYTRSAIDKCLYYRHNGAKVTYALVYVDDILLIGNDVGFRATTIQHITNSFVSISRQPVNDVVFLGMHIKKHPSGDISIDQEAYVTDLLQEYKITTTSNKPCSVNITNEHHVSDSLLADPTAYRSLNMQLLYLATRTRPDIMFPTTILATRSKSPTIVDYERLLKILQFLNGSKTDCLTFTARGKLQPRVFVDASFNLHWDAKGHTGFAIFPDSTSCAILVKSIKHKTIADSSTEAELIALHESLKYISWIVDLYLELGHDVRPVDILQDNLSAIALSSEESINFRGRSKFINRKYFAAYEMITNGVAKLVHIGTEDMIADLLTKAIVGSKFHRFRIVLLGSKSINE